MTSFVARPTFFEGQLLAAADLGELTDYVRARGERHHRYLHRPGLASGLALKAEDAKDAAGRAYKRVFVEPGIAVDPQGREIVVTEQIEVDAQRFRQAIGAGADAESFYPVMLRSVFRTQPAASGSLS